MNSNELGFASLLACSLVKKRVGTKYVASVRPRWPRYLFVEIPAGRSPDPLRNTRGFSTYLFNGRIMEVPEAAIELIKREGAIYGAPRQDREWPLPGDHARIVSGPFQGRVESAEIERVDESGEVAVFFEAFGRMVRLTLDREQIEAAA